MKYILHAFGAFLFIIMQSAGTAQTDTVFYDDVTDTHLPASMFGRNMAGAPADINNDGYYDILIAREFARNGLFINDGQGVFTDISNGTIPFREWDSEDIVVADFNNDSHPDIVFVNEDTQVHEFYLNNTNNEFIEIPGVLPNSIANAVAVIDANNDLYPDLLIGNNGQNFLLINNGDTTFSNVTAGRLPSSTDVTQDIALADLNSDGYTDIVFGNEDGNKVLINDGTGVFIDETSARLPLINEETRKVTLFDVDQDFDYDIFFSNVAFIPGKVKQNRLLINDGDGYFTDVTSQRLPPDYEHTMDAAFLDINRDGYIDFITANIFNNRPVKAFINQGDTLYVDKTFTVLPPGVNAEGIGLIVADFNSDQLQDIFIVNRRTPQQPQTRDRLLLRKKQLPTGINETGNVIPDKFNLMQNYPNPFNPSTVIAFTLPQSEYAALKIYNSLGEEIMILFSGELEAGEHKFEFNAEEFSSGTYIYRLTAGENSSVRKMQVIK